MATQLELEVRSRSPGRVKPPPEKVVASDRALSLDAYRGFVMLAMVSSGLAMAGLLKAHLPDSPANRVLLAIADQLEHRDWDMSFVAGTGCTPWDLIQPSFMFIVGAAMPFAFARRQERGESWGQQFLHVIRRSLLLIFIGIFLDTYGEHILTVQFIRVLQQIAIGYFIAFLVLNRGPVVQAVTAGLLLLGHGLAYLLYGWANSVYPWVSGPADLGGQDQILWQQTHNVGWHLEEWGHYLASCGGTYYTMLPLSKGHYVTINAISSAATILFGVLAGELLRKNWPGGRKLLILVVAGVAGILLGLALSPVLPINKKIWSASFGLFAGGCTALTLAAFYAVIEVLNFRRWTFPLVVVGMNSIAIYVMSGTIGSNIRQMWHSFLDVPLGALPMEAVPIVVAALTVLVEWGICYWLYRRRIFFKV